MQARSPSFGKLNARARPAPAPATTGTDAPPEAEPYQEPVWDPEERYRRMATSIGINKPETGFFKKQVPTTFWAGMATVLVIAALQMIYIRFNPPKFIAIHYFIVFIEGATPPISKEWLNFIINWSFPCVVWGVGFVLPVHYIVHPYRRAAGLINQAGYTIGGALVIGAISVFYSALSELPTGNPFIEFVRDYGIKTPMNGWVMEIVLGGVAGFFYSLFSGMEVTPLLDEKTRKKAGLPDQLTFGKM